MAQIKTARIECGCGGMIEVSSEYSSDLSSMMGDWLASHECPWRNEQDGASISFERLTNYANDLLSEHGENPEYDRALRELMRDIAGIELDRNEGWEDRYVQWRDETVHVMTAQEWADQLNAQAQEMAITVEKAAELMMERLLPAEALARWAETLGSGVRPSRLLTEEESESSQGMEYGVSVIFRSAERYKLWSGIESVIDALKLDPTPYDQIECWHCGSSDLEGDSVEFDKQGLSQKVWCTSCGKSWTEVYAFVGRIDPNDLP